MEGAKKALKYALGLLNRKDYTGYQLRNKLKEKGFDDDVIDETLNYLKEKNLINDERFAENYVYFRLQRGYGTVRIAFELKQKGVDDDIIERAIRDADEREAAKKVLSKHYTETGGAKERLKAINLLKRRGFKYDTINELFDEGVWYENV